MTEIQQICVVLYGYQSLVIISFCILWNDLLSYGVLLWKLFVLVLVNQNGKGNGLTKTVIVLVN